MSPTRSTPNRPGRQNLRINGSPPFTKVLFLTDSSASRRCRRRSRRRCCIPLIFLEYVDRANVLGAPSGKPPVPAWPLDRELVGGFIVLCGPVYAPRSIQDVIVPALKRMEKKHRGLHREDKLPRKLFIWWTLVWN